MQYNKPFLTYEQQAELLISCKFTTNQKYADFLIVSVLFNKIVSNN
jgi:hypothetical protein